jgi:hypothetical protein
MASWKETLAAVREAVSLPFVLTCAVSLFAVTRHLFKKMRTFYHHLSTSLRRRKRITMLTAGPDKYIIDGDKAIVASRQWPDAEW